MLQSKGIVVKPFIIGIGIDDKHKESLRCVGNFYDATNPEVFETVLGLVLEQALHNTTVEVRLLDEEGNPTVTDVPMTFTDLRSGAHHPQVVHTLSFNNLTDTFYLDPIPTYSLKLHTLPNRGMDSVQLSPGRHNIISVPDMEQGVISPQFPSSKRNAYNNLGVDVYESGACKSLYSIAIGESVTVLTGTYDLVFHTSPLTYVYDVIVEEDVPTNITIAAPGSFMLQSNASGFGSIVDANTLEHVIQLPSGNPSGRYTLQPGTYTIIFRARRARSSKYSIQSTFTITSGSTLNLNLHD
jgi:Ca-activated chloride channel family protein